MPGVKKALEHFHRSNVPIGVLSNTGFGEHVLRYELDKHGLANHLAFIMVSAEYCVRKPNVLLFDTAAVRLGVEPSEIWFVGDRLDTDISGAHAAGMTAVWLRTNDAQDTVSHDAHLVVADWAELLRRFQGAPLGVHANDAAQPAAGADR